VGWDYGDVIVWTYRSQVLPMRVVEDTADALVVWQAPGTDYLGSVPADGRDIRARPVEEMFTCEMVFAVRQWLGDGTLRIAPRDAAHSTWLFRSPDKSGTYLGWYGNLEAPLRRSDIGVHTVDHLLDVFVDFQGGVHWKDEHELAAGVVAGRFTEAEAAEIRAEGERVYAAMKNADYPYDGSWLDWKADASWDVPALPDEFALLAGQPRRDLFAI
jgi:uncharacterized protein DUF402